VSSTRFVAPPSAQERAAVNPLAALVGLLQRPLASYYLVLGTTGLLLAFGLMMVLSASSIDSYVESGSAFTVFNRQLLYAVVGLPAFWLGVRLPVRAYRVMGYPLLLVSAAALLVLFVAPSVGLSNGGASLWLQLGPVTVQPSEPAKLALALWGADVLVRKRALLSDWRHLALPLAPVTVGMLLLVGIEDLGTMLCLLLVVLALLWTSGVRLRVFAGLFVVAVAGVLVLISSAGYRRARLTSFLDPFADADDTGHQAVQGLYAMSTGGWMGVGLGESRGKWAYLPEPYNDFIFAIIGEELGVVGCLVVLGLFCAIAYTGLRIARRVADPFARLVAAACTIWLVGQAFINMGAVAGLLPITGIPLPLISAGGSSLVLTMFVLGMLASFARQEPGAAAALHARGRTAWTRLSGIPLPPLLGAGPGGAAGAPRRAAAPHSSPPRSSPQRSSPQRSSPQRSSRQPQRPAGRGAAGARTPARRAHR